MRSIPSFVPSGITAITAALLAVWPGVLAPAGATPGAPGTPGASESPGASGASAGGASLGAPRAGAGAPAPPPASRFGPGPRSFLRLAYCGTARRNDPQNELMSFPWDEAARAFDMTIVQSTANDYRRFVASLVRQNPEHRVLYYLHAHGLYPAEDRAGLANLTESNFVHATDPASLRVIPTAEGLLVDWERDERLFYDETGAISELREFGVFGYVVYRATGDGEFARVWPAAPPVAGAGASADSTPQPPVDVTEHLDRDVVPGTPYRYLVKTIGPVHHEYEFSWVAAAVAGDKPANPFVHEQQFALEAEIGVAPYTGRFRIRVETPGTRAVLHVDMNCDRDFADPGESFPMQPSSENFVEAVVSLEPRAHTDYDLITIYGFAYRLEVEGPGGRVVLPATGVYTTSINNRVRSAYYGFYVMHMDTAAWRERVETEVDVNARKGGMVSGVFLDELLFDPAMGADAPPVDLDQDGAVRAAAALVRHLRSGRPHLAVYMNGMGGLTPALVPAEEGSSSGPAAAELAPAARAILDTLAAAGLSGGMIEGFALAPWNRVRGGASGFPPPGVWMAEQAVAREVAARGLEALCLARPPAGAGVRGRLFAYASYLLASGPWTRFGYVADRCRGGPFPEWEVDLGAPGEILVADGGKAYGRSFERGEAWVNPEPQASAPIGARPGMTRRLALADSGSVGWEEAAGSLTLGPQSALVLLRDPEPGAGP